MDNVKEFLKKKWFWIFMIIIIIIDAYLVYQIAYYNDSMNADTLRVTEGFSSILDDEDEIDITNGEVEVDVGE